MNHEDRHVYLKFQRYTFNPFVRLGTDRFGERRNGRRQRDDLCGGGIVVCSKDGEGFGGQSEPSGIPEI
jgi:hypothetical protein